MAKKTCWASQITMNIFFLSSTNDKRQKMSLASFRLEENAQLWFIQLLNDYVDLTWDDFKQ